LIFHHPAYPAGVSPIMPILFSSMEKGSFHNHTNVLREQLLLLNPSFTQCATSLYMRDISGVEKVQGSIENNRISMIGKTPAGWAG